MPTDIENAAEAALELSNTVGATALNLQNTAQTARSLRRVAVEAARRPERLAAAGVALLALSAVLALRKQLGHAPGSPSTTD